MDNTSIVQVGSFTSDGIHKILSLRSDVDWIEVINYTQAAATTSGRGYRYTWQRGMGTEGLVEYHPAADATQAIEETTGNAFNLYDTSSYTGGTWKALSASADSDEVQPIYLTSDTTGLSEGAIVRLKDAKSSGGVVNVMSGVDFTVTNVVTNTSFQLASTLATAPAAEVNSGSYKLVANEEVAYKLFAPSFRNICNISKASSGVVTTLVAHGFVVGTRIRFTVPEGYGMTELNGASATITAVTDQTFTIDVDTSSFTTFAYPTTRANYKSYGVAMAVPYGQSTKSTYAEDSSPLLNEGYVGIILAPGNKGPAGNSSDVIYWRAGKAFTVNNN